MLIIKINSYRADAKAFKIQDSQGEDSFEFDMSQVDYITSDGFSELIKLLQSGKHVSLRNINDHIKETIEMIKLEQIL